VERSEQELIRRGKLQAIRETRYPFPNDSRVTTACEDVPKALESDPSLILRVAGRIVALRHMGKASFCQIQDRSGSAQLYIRKDDVGESVFEEFKTFDLGDIIFCEGHTFRTKTGEPTIHSTAVRLLVKCLHPLPEKWHGLSDVEIRYRQRYLDLIVNPEVRETFVKRAQIIRFIRNYFDSLGFVEVETPAMSSVASGAAARPFGTHHNALNVDLNMRIALELPLKKLVVGGLERVYEIGKCFRNEGVSTEHNPEFTMLEFYQAYATYEDLMDLTEELLTELCRKVCSTLQIRFRDMVIDFARPWRRLTMKQAVEELGGFAGTYDFDTLAGVQAAAAEVGFADISDISDYGRALYELFDRHIEYRIVNPTFITQHPTSISPLARANQDDPRFTDRFELMAAGMELANAFSELNDPEDQLERFEAQLRLKEAGDEEAMPIDRDFVVALEYGLPPTAGQGIGIDRLVMLLTDSASIRDVILFPTLRPLQE
jgi:lysyl-tRNA synthetase class 2